jgi:hypothetical protein
MTSIKKPRTEPVKTASRTVIAADSWGGDGSEDPLQLARAVKIELEHTHSREHATKIAMANLADDPSYYNKRNS